MMWKILPFFVTLFVVGLDSGVPGGIQDINPNDPGFQRAMKFAVFKFNSNPHHKHIYYVVRVLKAQRQIVAGVAYIMTLELGKTFCTKDLHRTFCPMIKNQKLIICSFTVVDAPWLGGMRLTDSKCQQRNPLGYHILRNNRHSLKKPRRFP